jgi:hypothetical protein
MQNDTCYILALFKRDDGERLLLGSGFYEFDKGQKHFNPNTFANDIVELQGADGQLLAGQVRRSTSQSFDGVIGDGTTSKATVEQKRREFFLFFRKQHHYTVVYIFPDGSAIKRDRGYITDAPAVQELYQVQPKWHIALAFEDVNYYSYAEDAQGNEIYFFEAELGLANIADGGLVWDADGATSDAYTFTGKNLIAFAAPAEFPIVANGLTITRESDGSFTINGNTNSAYNYMLTVSGSVYASLGQYVGQTVTLSCQTSGTVTNLDFRNFGIKREISGDNLVTTPSAGPKTATLALNPDSYIGIRIARGNFTNYNIKIQLELGSDDTDYEPAIGGQTTGGYVFEPSTGGGPIVVTVNGVDDANPVWHVYGPATNPTLTNSTTGEALTWNGTVPADQELIIDMGQQTATLEGANVFEYVSGSWVQLAPGQNRISYTAANTTSSSKVFWNEVVG